MGKDNTIGVKKAKYLRYLNPYESDNKSSLMVMVTLIVKNSFLQLYMQ